MTTAIALLMILFGSAEIVTAFSHHFFGVETAAGPAAVFVGAGIGAAYALAGLLVLTRRRGAAALALACLTLVIAGRLALVATGLFPLGSFQQAFAMTTGTAIAIGFAVYIAWRWRSFR